MSPQTSPAPLSPSPTLPHPAQLLDALAMAAGVLPWAFADVLTTGAASVGMGRPLRLLFGPQKTIDKR